MLLAVDRNEVGKTTLCEAIVTALYGFTRVRGAGKPKDLRRPRSGAPFGVALDLEAEGVFWSIERDLTTGVTRIVDRQNGTEKTGEFSRSGNRDLFGEKVTGLSEGLFRSTAYVAQNILDDDQLDSSLTIELARIADAGGGEASVMRALRSLAAARVRMPDSLTGPTVSVETEVSRADRMVTDLEKDEARRKRALREAAEASARCSQAEEAMVRAGRAVVIAEAAVDEVSRASLASQLQEFERADQVRERLRHEAERLETERGGVPSDLLDLVERLRSERGSRPESLVSAQERLQEEARGIADDEATCVRRFGPAFRVGQEDRERLSRILHSVVESEAEVVVAEEELKAQWAEMAKEGLAEDIRRLDLLSQDEKDFLHGAEESRQALEMAGVLSDRRRADARHQLTIIRAERKHRVGNGQKLCWTALGAGIVTLLVLVAGHGTASHWVAGGGAFAVTLATTGAVLWAQGRTHRVEEERIASQDEARYAAEGEKARRELSSVRLHLDQVARRAGFPDPLSLVKAHRRARQAETKRRELATRAARRDAVSERRSQLEREVEPFRPILESSAGLPSSADARKVLALLEDVDRSLRTLAARREAIARSEESLAAERSTLSRLEQDLTQALRAAGVPEGLSLAEGFAFVAAARRRAVRLREIVEVELPARKQNLSSDEVGSLGTRIAALTESIDRRLQEAGAHRSQLPSCKTLEEARAAGAGARDEERLAREELAAAEKVLAAISLDGADRAREVVERLAEARAILVRARLFRDALDLAQEALTAAASRAYGDFRQGLHEASRRILSAWDLPYEALEFGDDLGVTVRTREGRTLTRLETAGGLSTGTREQLHLTARLAALEYLGTGTRGVPLLLDDPLVGADDVRFGAVMRFLLEKVLPERPVLIVSCHGWRHEKLLEGLDPLLRDRLEKVSLSPTG